MHPVQFTEATPGRSRVVPVIGRTSAVPELGQLVLAEHAHILRLFAALGEAGRRGHPAPLSDATLAQLWDRLAELTEAYADTEEEICYPVVFGRGPRVAALVNAAIADHDDIRAAVAEARLAELGSACWWRAVAGARRACAGHFASEEQALLAEVCAGLNHEADKVLVRQWRRFAAARAGDATPMRPQTGMGVGALAAGSQRWLHRPDLPGDRNA
jgi:Hemerythrin HHE cation binding domain